MANDNTDKKNTPPTGEGKDQSPYSGKANELSKRSEVLQAQRNHPEENFGSEDEEPSVVGASPQEKADEKKAGR